VNIVSFSAVARAAGAHVFHFCKYSEDATGLKISDYVARVRGKTQKARCSIPIICASARWLTDVGFNPHSVQSNVWRIFGTNPDEYRAKNSPYPEAPCLHEV
jgi:hypothetical protein